MNDFAKYQFILNLVNSAISLTAIVVVWWRTREKAVSNKFTGIHNRLDGIDKRVTETESKVSTPSNHCPGHVNLTGRCDAQREDLTEQEIQFTKVQGEFKAQLKQLEGELNNLPKLSDLEKIYQRINELGKDVSNIRADVSEVSGAMPGIVHVTQMMNQYLLSKGDK